MQLIQKRKIAYWSIAALIVLSSVASAQIVQPGGNTGGGGTPGTAVPPVTRNVTVTQGTIGVCIPNLSTGCSGFTGTIATAHGQGALAAVASVRDGTTGEATDLGITYGAQNGFSAGDIVLTANPTFTGVIEIGSGGGTAFNATGAVVYSAGPPATTTLRDFVSIKDPTYGAVGNATVLTDGAMTSGSAVLTTAHTFTSGDVGDVIVVGQAGAPMLSAPSAPVVTTTGTPGATTYSYVQVCYLSDGTHTPASAAGSVATGNATLGGMNGNVITFSGNCDHWSVWKTAGPGAQGFIINLISAATYTDLSGVGDGTTAPATNTVIGTNLLTTIASVAAGVATLSATASSTTVGNQVVDFGPNVAGDTTAFQTAGTNLGPGGRIVVPPGIYLLSNTAAVAMADINFLNQQWDFMPGAQIICTDKSSSAHSCFQWYGNNAVLADGLIVNGLNVNFAGDPRILKGIYAASGAVVLNGTNHVTMNGLRVRGSPGTGVSMLNTQNTQLVATEIDNTTTNPLFGANNANPVITGYLSSGGGDNCVELDYLNTGGYTAGLTGGLVVNANCINSYGGFYSAGNQGVSFVNSTVTNTCEQGTGVVFDHGTPSFQPADVSFIGVKVFNPGTYDSPYLGGQCRNSAGFGAYVNGGITSATWQNFTVEGSAADPIHLEVSNGSYTSGNITLSQVRLSNNTGDFNAQYTTNLNLGTLEMDHQTGAAKFSHITNLFGSGRWSALDVCTAGSACSNRAFDLENNTNDFVPPIGVIDDQGTATGYKVLESGATASKWGTVSYAITDGAHPFNFNTQSNGTCVPDPTTLANLNCSAPTGGLYQFYAGATKTIHITSGGSIVDDQTGSWSGSNTMSTGLYQTATNCSSAAAPAVCASASSGSVVVAASATTVVVNTTRITANSQVQLTFDSSLGTKLSVTCNTTPVQGTVSARTAATSFTITVPSAPSANPACFSYTIVN